MKLQKILIGFILLISSLLIINTTFAAINMTISPIKYELDSSTWSILTREAKLTNHTSDTIHIITWKSDFIANWDNWAPRFIRKSEVVFEQELSDWITIDTPSFVIWPNKTKIINFTINIPDNATPGWHYWAVFFKNNNSEQSGWTNVWINVDYWILILLNIDWVINSEIEIWEPIIWGNSGSVKHMDICNENWWDKSWNYYDWKCLNDNASESNSWSQSDNTEFIWENNEKQDIWNNIDKQKDDCIVDLTSSNYDKKCIDNFDEIISELTWNIEKENIETSIDDEDNTDQFEIKITVPVENKWNTHVKPQWKITLIDEDWNEIKKIWKKLIINDKWAIVWEEIVDYIPFNDIWWNILPWTNRKYNSNWKWFPYSDYTDDWEKVIKYLDPSEYYTKENFKKYSFIYPWKTISSREKDQTIVAKFNINYLDEDWNTIEYNSAKDFNVKYTERYLWLNPYFFFLLWWALFILLILWVIFKKKKQICINKECKKKIDKDMKVCPYCWTNQYNKKIKKYDDKKPIILAAKKQKLKTKQLELKESTKSILIENKLKYAKDLEKLTKNELLEIRWIWKVAINEIIEALKNEKMKLKK